MKWGTTPPPPPPKKIHPSPPPPQTSPLNGNKKHEVVKLMHEPFTQHKCQQIRKTKSNLKK